MELIYEQRIEYINELTEILHRPLNDIIKLLTQHIKISNKKMRVLIKCENCGKEKETYMCKINVSNFQFCSHKCYSEFRKKYYIGERASVYKSTIQKCDWCNKEILIPPYKNKELNKIGENHNFCNHDCYSKFRSKYYIGDKLYNTGIKLSDEQIERCRVNTAKCYMDGKITRQTIPQKITNNILDKLNINYTNEYLIKYYSIDNYLFNDNLLIEVQGDYFHSNPLLYQDYNKLNKMQIKNIIRDKRKQTYVKKYNNIDILYLWENDLKNNQSLCEMLIQLYIENNGILKDYQSFNYHIYHGVIKINTKILNPFFIN